MKVTQTQVESLRRMDISVRRAEAPEETSLAVVSGFYGTAIGGAGSGGMPVQWAGTGAPGSQPDEETGQNKGQDGGSTIDQPQPIPEPELPPGAQPEEQ
jgi:hypothetical protein